MSVKTSPAYGELTSITNSPPPAATNRPISSDASSRIAGSSSGRRSSSSTRLSGRRYRGCSGGSKCSGARRPETGFLGTTIPSELVKSPGRELAATMSS